MVTNARLLILIFVQIRGDSLVHAEQGLVIRAEADEPPGFFYGLALMIGITPTTYILPVE